MKNWLKDTWKIWVPILVLLIIGILIALTFSEPPPPKQFVLAAGDSEGAYYAFGQQYQNLFAKDKIKVEVRATAGSLENLELLDSGQADIGFIQGGVRHHAEISQPMYSIASVYYEPLWVFYRGEDEIQRLSQLASTRIGIGAKGSGTQSVTKLLLQVNGITGENAKLLPMGVEDSVAALKSGELDVGFFVASPVAPFIHQLLQMTELRLMNFQRHLAYARNHYFLRGITIPQGLFDLQYNIPPQDIILLATTATLVGRGDLHPRLIEHILKTITPLHRKKGLLEVAGEFPSALYADFPLYEVTEQYFHSGPSTLSRYFPYWMVSLISRLKILIISVLPTILLLVKFAPMAYRWGMSKRIYQWYNVLYDVETDLENESSPESLAQSIAQLQELDDEVTKVSVPANYRKEVYNLRMHINLVVEELEQQLEQHEAALGGVEGHE